MRYRPHAVYLMWNTWSQSNYKIGFSNNPTRRGVEVDDQYGVEPRIISACWFPSEFDARAAEKIWHTRYSEFRSDDHSGREWFSLTASQVEEFKAWCSLSLTHQQLLDGLFKGHLNLKQVKALTSTLFTRIPKPMPRESIDVWLADQQKTKDDNANTDTRRRVRTRA